MEYFKDNFNSVEEQPEPVITKVKGEVPNWLTGTFMRVGPGKFDLGDFTVNHWMDGMAIVYKFTIDGGEVSFRSKYLISDAYKKACVAQRPIYTEFGTHSYPDPCKNIFSRMFSNFDCHIMTDNASNNIISIEDQVFVATETCFIRRVDPITLETKEKVDLNKYASVNFASSHPMTDASGAVYNLGGTFIGGPKYHIIRVPPNEEKMRSGSEPWMNARILTSIPSSWRASYGYYHSFGMSENYIVFLEQPLTVNTLKLATSQVKSKSMHDCLEWNPQEKVKFIVINKTTGEVIKVKYQCDTPFFIFHHVNTYEEMGHLVVDVVAYPSPEILDKLYLNKVRMNEYSNEDPAQLKRFVLPLVHDLQSVPEGQELVSLSGTTASAMKVREGANGTYIRLTGVDIGEPGWDMPVVNSKFEAKPYNFVYGTGGYEKGHFKNAVSKIDVETGKSWLWRGTEYQYLSEPVFVTAPNAIDEDDGVLLVSVCDVRPGSRDFMLVLDARNMEEIARCEVNVKVPNGLHGVFLQDKV